MGSSFDTVLAVYTGSSVSALTGIAADDNSGTFGTSKITFSAQPGLEYRFAVDGSAGASGSVVLNLSAATPPANDLFSDRIALTGLANSITGSDANGASEPGEPKHAGNAGGRSVWWSWTAPTNLTVTVDTLSSSFDTVLAIYTGSNVSALTPVAADDNSGTFGASRVSFLALAGVTYHFAVDGAAGASGALALNVKAIVPLANDLFANRIALIGVTNSVVGSNAGASKEPGEPEHFNDARGTSANGTSIWWTWAAPTNLTVTAEIVGSSFTPVVAVYTGDNVSELTLIGSASSGSRGRAGQVTFSALPGVAYHFAVDGLAGATGEVTLSMNAVPPPPNDMFSARIRMTGTNSSVTGSLVGATVEPGELDRSGAGPSSLPSIWWTWTAPTNGPVTLDTLGSSSAPSSAGQP